MVTTTSKNVRAANKPAAAKAAPAKAAAKPVREKAKPAPVAEEPEEAKRGPLMVVIDGAGTMPLVDNNGRRVMRGEPVEVSEEEIAWLAASRCEFKRV